MNNTRNKKADLGREMAEQRELKGLSVEQLSDITKISAQNIRHIENGVLDFLPSAYVKAYLSALARELGLDPDLVLKKYHASFIREVDPGTVHMPETSSKQPKVQKTEKQPDVVPPGKPAQVETGPQPSQTEHEKEPPKVEPEPEEPGTEIKSEPAKVEKEIEKPKPEIEKPPVKEAEPVTKPEPVIAKKERPFQPTPVVTPPVEKGGWFEDFKLLFGFYSIFIYAFLIIAALVTALIIFVPRLKDSDPKNTETMVVEQEMSDTTSVAGTETPQAAQPLSLRMVVSDTTWLRIVYDEDKADEAVFIPGMERTWESETVFWMRIGNASGIRLYLNDEDLGVPGRAGSITNLKIDKDGFEKIRKEIFPKLMNIEGS